MELLLARHGEAVAKEHPTRLTSLLVVPEPPAGS